MKSYKTLLNEWAHKTDQLHLMSDEERKLVQRRLLEMYIDIRDLCKEHHLTLMLGGGSCLGAIRHKGFIPWDDDLDLVMLRKDYNQLLELLKEGKLGDGYEFRYPDGKMYSSSAFLKIYRKGTVFCGIGGEQQPYPCGLFIDIFPIEGVPAFKPWRVLIGFIANGLRFVGNCVAEYQFEGKSLEKAMEGFPELQAVVRRRHRLGKLFSFLDSRAWMHLFDRLVADERITPLVTIPTGRKLYAGEMIASKLVTPASEVLFEGVTAEVYHDPDAYLTLLYGDYMTIPPVEERECHFVKNVKL